MEAVPRMYMLSLELKDTADRSEFGPELKRYINQHYMEDGEKYSDEIRQLEQLRMNAINATRDFNGISMLKKYFGQLHNLASRFPMEEGGEAAVYFSWIHPFDEVPFSHADDCSKQACILYHFRAPRATLEAGRIDTFDEEPFTHADIRFEQACILYNLGALHAVLGAREGRGNEEEMKVACTHFQCAAGIFTYLKQNFTADTSPDLSIELMAIYLQTMLGQAQECLLEKSMQDNRKCSLVARISTQVTDYYQQALRGLEDINITSLLGSRRTKLWKRTLTAKMLHFASISYLYMSNQSEGQQKYGERVAYLQAATDKHNEAMKIAKGQHETVVEALNFAKDIIIGKFQSAKKDNDFVYHEKVPDIDTLPEVKGASLVKALAFQPCEETVVGPDIFRKLVPMKAHEASSMYSEEKAKLLRDTVAGMEEKDKELEQYMASLQVDQLKLGEDEPETIPQILLEVCAAISVKEEPIRTLVTSMQGLSNVVLDVDGALNEIDAILEEEAKLEKQFQNEFGVRAAKNYDEIRKDLVKCRGLHAKASQSNTELRKAMETHIENIKVLASPLEDIQAALPSLKSTESSVDKEAESTLKRLLDKVEEMKGQRKDFEQQLREALQKDDITNDIVTKQQGNLQAFFQKQLEKHSALVTYIKQNLTAQDNILRALTDAHAAYADSKKVTSDTIQKREDKIQELVASFTVYDDLIAKSNKGVDFYKKLEVTVSKLLAKTKELIEASENERKEKISKMRAPPQRPYAPKPVGPTPNVPAGPKLSDFWKPKSSPDRRRGRTDDAASGLGAQHGVGPGVGTMGGHPPHHPAQYGSLPPSLNQGPPMGAQSQTPHMGYHDRTTTVHQPQVSAGGPSSLPPQQGGHVTATQVPPPQPTSLPSVPISAAHPSSPGPGHVQHPGVPHSTGQTPYGAQYSHGGGPQGFPSLSQIPPHNQNAPIPQSLPSGGSSTLSQGMPVGSQYQHVSQVPSVSQPNQPTLHQPPVNQPQSNQITPPVSQQQVFNQPQNQFPTVSQNQQPVSQQQAFSQPASRIPPVSQMTTYNQPPASQNQAFNQPPSVLHTNQVPASQGYPAVSGNQQMMSQPNQQLPRQQLPQQQSNQHQQPLFNQQQQMYNQPHQIPQNQATNEPQPPVSYQLTNQQPASQAQGIVSQSQAFNQKPYSPHQQVPNQPQSTPSQLPMSQAQPPVGQPQAYSQFPSHTQTNPELTRPPPTSQAQPPISQPRGYNQYTSQGYQPSIPTAGIVQQPNPAASQANQAPQHRVYPPASSALGGDLRYRTATPQGYVGEGQGGSTQYQQPSYIGQSAGPRFESPVHQQRNSQQSGYPNQVQFAPRQPGPLPQTGAPGSHYQQQQQYPAQTHGYPGPNQSGAPPPQSQQYGSPHQFPRQRTPQQAQPPQQQNLGPTYGVPSKYPSQQPPPMGASQSFPPPVLSANPVKNVNMRLKAEQQSLPSPTLQPTRLKKDLLSSSPEDKSPLSQSEILVPQNVKGESTTDQGVKPEVTPQPSSVSQGSMSVPPQKMPPVPSNFSSQVSKAQVLSSNLAILSQPVPTSSSSSTRVDAVPPNSNQAILSQPVVGQKKNATPVNVAPSKAEGGDDSKDPYLDKAVLDRFVDEVERLEKYIEGLHRQMLSGPTVLDGVWKEVNDGQEKETRQFSISVARCYPTKNRHPDIMPYDHNRVTLKTSNDDFINASYVRDLSPSTPTFIATQAPLPATMETFWQMIYEQQVFLLVMLVSSKSKGTSEFHQYWPAERGQSQRHGAFAISLQSSKNTEFHVERFLQLTHVPTKQVRTVLQMQFMTWPEFGVPSQASDLLQFVSRIHNYHLQQKRLTLPIVVHCSSGVDRTGTFCTIYSAVQEINSGRGITDIPKVVKNLRGQRKWMVSEKEQLKFCYEAVLCYAQQVLAKRGIFSKMSGTLSPRPPKNAPSRLNSFDVIMGADSVQSLQHSISKLSVRPPAENQGVTVEDTTPNLGASHPPHDDSSLDDSSHARDASTEREVFQESPTEEAVNPSAHQTEAAPAPKPTSVSEMLETNLDSFSHRAQGSLPPDVVESSTISQPSLGMGGSEGVLPSILEDLTPQNFTIKEEEKPKGKKFSKEDFEKRKNHLGAPQEGGTGDPFSTLDPLWSMKGQSSK